MSGSIDRAFKGLIVKKAAKTLSLFYSAAVLIAMPHWTFTHIAGLASSVTESVTGAVSHITDKAGEMFNHFIETLAIMLVTCCIIPVLVLLSFVSCPGRRKRRIPSPGTAFPAGR